MLNLHALLYYIYYYYIRTICYQEKKEKVDMCIYIYKKIYIYIHILFFTNLLHKQVTLSPFVKYLRIYVSKDSLDVIKF